MTNTISQIDPYRASFRLTPLPLFQHRKYLLNTHIAPGQLLKHPPRLPLTLTRKLHHPHRQIRFRGVPQRIKALTIHNPLLIIQVQLPLPYRIQKAEIPEDFEGVFDSFWRVAKRAVSFGKPDCAVD